MLKLLTRTFMILTRRGPWTIKMHPLPKRFVFWDKNKIYNFRSDSSVGKELESSSRGESNTRGFCRGHQQEETNICNSSERRSEKGVQTLI